MEKKKYQKPLMKKAYEVKLGGQLLVGSGYKGPNAYMPGIGDDKCNLA